MGGVRRGPVVLVVSTCEVLSQLCQLGRTPGAGDSRAKEPIGRREGTVKPPEHGHEQT